MKDQELTLARAPCPLDDPHSPSAGVSGWADWPVSVSGRVRALAIEPAGHQALNRLLDEVGASFGNQFVFTLLRKGGMNNHGLLLATSDSEEIQAGLGNLVLKFTAWKGDGLQGGRQALGAADRGGEVVI